MIRLLALDKWARFVKIIVKNGGPIKSVFKLWRNDTLKVSCRNIFLFNNEKTVLKKFAL